MDNIDETFPKNYDFKSLEDKWRKTWDKKELFKFSYTPGDRKSVV